MQWYQVLNQLGEPLNGVSVWETINPGCETTHAALGSDNHATGNNVSTSEGEAGTTKNGSTWTGIGEGFPPGPNEEGMFPDFYGLPPWTVSSPPRRHVIEQIHHLKYGTYRSEDYHRQWVKRRWENSSYSVQFREGALTDEQKSCQYPQF